MTAVTWLEGLTDCFITAVGVSAGAAHLYPACGTFAAVLIVDTVLHITVYSADLFLFHQDHSFSFCKGSIC